MLQHVSLVSYGSKLHSSHEHGMFLSTGLAVLCSAQMRELCPFPISFYWGCILKKEVFLKVFLEAA